MNVLTVSYNDDYIVRKDLDEAIYETREQGTEPSKCSNRAVSRTGDSPHLDLQGTQIHH